jgi:hypothetical protein
MPLGHEQGVSLRQLAQRSLRLRDDLANDVARGLNLGD